MTSLNSKNRATKAKEARFASEWMPRGGTLKSFIMLGMSFIVLSFLLLAAGWLWSVARLNDTKERLFTDAQSLRASYQLELSVREVETSRGLATLPRDEAARTLTEMSRYSTTPQEAALLRTLAQRFDTWERGGDLLPLLSSIDAHRALNESQMRASMEQSAHLERWLRLMVPLLLAGAIGALAWGGWKLWSRLFEPALQLSYAAHMFGLGAMWSRAPVRRADEMGALCQTFNTMADALRDREQERLHFVAGVAHDLKNPLVVIGGVAHLLERNEVPPDERQDWLGRLRRQVRVLEGLVEDFTDSVGAQTGHLTLNREPLDLCALCRALVGEQSAAPEGKRLCFEGESACPILGDHRRLERATSNLLSNALKYGGEGEVTVSVWRRGAEAVLCVRDQGEGLSPEDLARLFRPYARLDRHHRVTGSGLGLVSVQKITEAHGGAVQVFSEPGHGTLFELHFKLHEPTGEHHEPLSNPRIASDARHPGGVDLSDHPPHRAG